jgi:transposase
MTEKRRKHTATFKAKVALEALKERSTTRELSVEYGLHSTQINTWKQVVKEGAPSLFDAKAYPRKEVSQEPELYEQIGRLKMQLDWLKKKLEG